MEIVLAILGFLGPFIKYTLEWVITRGKTSDLAKKKLDDAYKVIVDKRHRALNKIKKLEERLEHEHTKMDEIKAGKRKFAWQKDKVDNNASK